MAEPRQYCTFMLDGLYFGVDVKEVQEVIRFHDMTPVPLAPEVIQGLINLRGQIVTAVDLRRRLELRPAPADRKPMNVVVRSDDSVASLLVDQIGDVVEVDESFEKPPDTLEGAARELILGAHKLEKRLLLVLDTRRVLELSDAGPAGTEEKVRMKALIIDDSGSMRMLLKRILEDLGVEDEQAQDGKVALAVLGDKGPFELALVDWQMPVMDGIEFVKAVREKQDSDSIKLVMVTSVNQIEKVVEALESGADEYIMKPFTKEALAEELALLGFEIG